MRQLSLAFDQIFKSDRDNAILPCDSATPLSRPANDGYESLYSLGELHGILQF